MAARIAGLIAAVLFLSVLVAACVDVPEGIRANFAAPAPQERSNYRPGEHGTARPEAPPPPPVTAQADAGEVGTTTTTSSDGGAP